MKTTLHMLRLLTSLTYMVLGSACTRQPLTVETKTAPPAASAVATTTDATKPLAMQDSTAEKMLIFQRSIGGWPKAVGNDKVDYTHPLSAAARAATLADKNRNDATIDNNATTREISYLVKAYARTHNPAYKSGAENGIRYLLKMQYANGGFPQFYPDMSGYRHQITYNDNAMIKALEVLRAVAKKDADYVALDPTLVPLAQDAVSRGIDCILKTQYVRNGKPTAWCAQYDEKTLLPDKARAFELASLSGDESVNIVRFLMAIENPSAQVKAAVENAVAWLNKVKMPDMAVKDIDAPNEPKGRDRVIVSETGATLWARFYDLNTDRPIYVGRDSKVHFKLAEVENERRAGYLYAGTWPAKLLSKEYPAWQQRMNAQK